VVIGQKGVDVHVATMEKSTWISMGSRGESHGSVKIAHEILSKCWYQVPEV
jgi:hypothetical protein